jgi:starch-binding outer membrane protein, SusD/RagB family
MIHKNIKIKLLSFAICSVLLTTSCEEQDFLTQVNPNAINNQDFWKTSTQFQSGLTTVYGALQFQTISGGGVVNEEILGDIGGTETWYGGPFSYRTFTYNDTSEQVTNKWSQLYTGIFRANQVINNLQNADETTFATGEKASIEAQARLLRAFFYFQLVNTYGGAVIHMTVPVLKADFQKPFSSMNDVNKMIIIPDLEYAKLNLPKTWSGKDLGRVTWGAATSLLGKTYLFEKKWAEASSQFKEVIDSNIYSLTANIMDNFTEEGEFNSESILEVAYSATENPGASGDNTDSTPYVPGSEASNIARAYGQLNYGGYNTLLPSYYLHELYVNDEVDRTNPINTTNLQSRRMTASIAPKNLEGQYYLRNVAELKGWGFGQSAYIKKYTNWYHSPNEDALSRSGINFRQIRLADVYLMYAEAVLNASGNVNEAIKYIDLVRSRAGVKTLTQYLAVNGNTFPQLHISKQVHGTQPMVAPTKENVLTHIQRVERPLELAFEGHRWKDLVRWGIVQKVFDELRADEIWRENNYEAIKQKAPLFIDERIRDDFKNAVVNYESTVHNYFPIPAVERQTNNSLGK